MPDPQSLRRFLLPFLSLIGIGIALSVVGRDIQPPLMTKPMAEPASAPFAFYISGAGIVEEMMAETDTDGDGTISKDELSAIMEKHSKDGKTPDGGPSVDDMFSEMDSNGDGSVDQTELSAFAAKGPPEGGGGPKAAGGGGGPSAAGGASSSSSESYDVLDTNKDGVVSLSERLAGSTSTTESATSGKLTSQTLNTLLQSVNEIAA